MTKKDKLELATTLTTIVEDYHATYNTSEVRSELKQRFDSVLETVPQILDWRVVCNRKNNRNYSQTLTAQVHVTYKDKNRTTEQWNFKLSADKQ